MPKTIAYLRVSTTKQDLGNQELEIRRYCQNRNLNVDHWYKLEMSSRRTSTERRVDELLRELVKGDILIVSELSRLGRSLGQVVQTVDSLMKEGIRFIAVKENIDINGKHDIASKVMVGMFSLFAEIERDLISERTKAGLARARAEGKLLGRPKGTKGKSRLDGREEEIRGLLAKGVSKASIAKIMDVSAPTLHHFLKSRGITL